jgi:UrcA family protein
MNTSKQNQLRAAILSLFGAATLFSLQAGAAATTTDPLPTRKVTYADLDISKPAGAKVLYSRIVAAANEVCSFNGSRELTDWTAEQACIKKSIDEAVKDVNSTALSELHTARVLHLASNN